MRRVIRNARFAGLATILTLLVATGTRVLAQVQSPSVRPIPSWADRVDLADLAPYTHPSAAWSDRHSDVAISWPDPGAPGLQRLESVVGWGGTKITDGLLRWAVAENGSELPLKLLKRSYSPAIVTEKSTTGDLIVTTSAAFPERNVIAVRFDVGTTALLPGPWQSVSCTQEREWPLIGRDRSPMASS